MKNLIIALVIVLNIPTISLAGSAFHIGFSEINIGYSNIRHHGYRHHGYRHHRPVVNGYRHIHRHIHRQEGRRYVNDFPCAPVVVVPSGSSYYRYNSDTYYGY